MTSTDKCPLCNLEKLTHWYWETKKFIVCVCKTCDEPMYVFKSHDFPNLEEVAEMVIDAKDRFVATNYILFDFKQRSIENHFHFHVRKPKE